MLSLSTPVDLANSADNAVVAEEATACDAVGTAQPQVQSMPKGKELKASSEPETAGTSSKPSSQLAKMTLGEIVRKRWREGAARTIAIITRTTKMTKTTKGSKRPNN